jgi:hypothetical protein
MRQSSKMMVVATFALAVLAGLAFAALRRRLHARAAVAAAAAAVALVAADSSTLPAPGATISLLPARVPAYEQAFAGRPGQRVVNVPIWPGNDAWSSHYLYYATLYRTVMVNGYRPVLPPGYEETVFRPLAALNAGQVQERQYELLRRMGVEYLAFHEESYPPKVGLFPAQFALDNLLASPYLALASGSSPVWVFRIRPPAEVTGRAAPRLPAVAAVALAAADAGAGEVRADAESSGGWSLLAGGDLTALALHRPRTTPAGRYTLSLRVKPPGPGAATFDLSVRRADGDAVVARRSFTEEGAGWRTVTLEFALEESTRVYYLLEKPGGVALALDWLYLRFADQTDPLETFTFDEMYHTGNTTPDPRAASRRAVRLGPDDPAGQATRGPYRLYGPGRYRLALSLALDAAAPLAPDTVVATVALRNHLDEEGAVRDLAPNLILPEQQVRAGTLAGGGYRELAFPFALDRPTFLSVNVGHAGRGLLLDRARVERLAP